MPKVIWEIGLYKKSMMQSKYNVLCFVTYLKCSLDSSLLTAEGHPVSAFQSGYRFNIKPSSTFSLYV